MIVSLIVAFVACRSPSHSGRGVLVPESHRQVTGGEVDIAAHWASKVPEARLP